MSRETLKQEINPVCKSLVSSYVLHMEKSVKEGKEEYISLGVDGSVEDYRSTFLNTLGDYLEHREVATETANEREVREETKKVWEETMMLNGHYPTLTNHKNLIYNICENIIDKILRGVKR